MTAFLGYFILLANGHFAAGETPGTRDLLDAGWRFHLGNAAERSKDFGFGGPHEFSKSGDASGPARSAFSDSRWRVVNLPHDFVVESPIERDSDNSHGFRPTGRNYPDKAIGWYRRRFEVPRSDLGQRITIEFDGVYRDCMVWLNGHLVGRNQSGYIGFSCDVTDDLNYGGNNVLVVRADVTQGEGWFYEGGGIYRHVWLVKKKPVHVPQYGLGLVPAMRGKDADVTVETEVTNESDKPHSATVESEILDPEGKQIVRASSRPVTVAPWTTQTVRQKLPVRSPRLWSPDDPTLYKGSSRIVTDGALSDQTSSTFGFRTVTFDPGKGMLLNGVHTFVNGTCNHQDHAGVGSAVPDAVQAFRIRRLRDMGCNAYRTSHNPPTAELLDACDKLGMMVMDENRLLDSSAEGLSQMERLIRRDRNHPSVILWSVANEEFAVQGTEPGRRIAESLIRKIHSIDTTRLISYAGNNGGQFEGVNSVVDVRGVNYAHGDAIDQYHAAHPNQPVMGSEDGSTVSTRGEYANDRQKGYVRSYDTEAPPWANTAEQWMAWSRARPWYAGAFIWTGFDYRGEPTPYGWPCVNSHFGILDTCGFPKDNFYFYKAWWGKEDLVHILPHWTWDKPGAPIDVWCYSNADEVELLLNGQSIGRKPMPKYGHAAWLVPYSPGTLEAKGFRGGKLVASDKVETAGAPAKVVLSADRTQISADGSDVAVVTVSVVDAKGIVVPGADQDVTFSIENGSILGVGNGDPSSHEEDRFFGASEQVAPKDWTMVAVPNGTTTLDKVDWSGAKPVSISGQTDQVPSDSNAAFRGTFEVSADAIRQNPSLLVSQIDDFGWVYLNGKKVGETTQWDRSYTFDVAGVLKEGVNTLEILVRNNAAEGGLGTVGLSWAGALPTPHRKVFHGLAQVIVGATSTAGKVTLRASAPGLDGAVLEVDASSR